MWVNVGKQLWARGGSSVIPRTFWLQRLVCERLLPVPTVSRGCPKVLIGLEPLTRDLVIRIIPLR